MTTKRREFWLNIDENTYGSKEDGVACGIPEEQMILAREVLPGDQGLQAEIELAKEYISVLHSENDSLDIEIKRLRSMGKKMVEALEAIDFWMLDLHQDKLPCCFPMNKLKEGMQKAFEYRKGSDESK